jgi:hypothetical protein
MSGASFPGRSALAVAATLMLVMGIFSPRAVDAGKIDIINQCGQTITACATCCGGGKVNCYVLNGRGGRQQIDVGGNWPAGVIWGFPGNSGNPGIANNAKPQANLAELTIGANGQDYYDISNVDAYNLPMRMNPTQIAGGGSPSGTHCGTIICSIGDLNGFCKSPNYQTGYPGYGCKNKDGPGQSATDGTRAFKNQCPNAYSYSKDDKDVVYGCQTGSNYEVVFCPYGSTIREVVPEANSS